MTTAGPLKDVPDKAAIRGELELTRERYHALLASVGAADWHRPSTNRDYTIAMVLAHVASGPKTIVSVIGKAALDGKKGAFPLPTLLLNIANRFITRRGGNGASAATCAATYDEGHRIALAALDVTRDDQWHRSTRLFDETITYEGVFHRITHHFEEHEAEVLSALGRNQAR